MKKWLVLCLLLVVSLLNGCDTSSVDDAAVPDMPLMSIFDNEAMSLSDINEPIYLVNIWATWCSQCKLEHDYLLEISANMAIIGIANSDFPEKVKPYLEQQGNPYTVVLDDLDGELSAALGAYGTPETFLIKNKQIIAHVRGVLTPDLWQAEFKPHL